MHFSDPLSNTVRSFLTIDRLHVAAGRFVDPLSPNLRVEGNFQAQFSRRKSIQCSTPYRVTYRVTTLSGYLVRRVFLRYVNISTRIFGDNVSCPGLYGGLYAWLYGQNLLYKFKNSYGDFQNRNFEKSHRTKFTGPLSDPWSDLRPDC
jgi:hypothetical protein